MSRVRRRMEEALALKKEGTASFTKGEYRAAIVSYCGAAEALADVGEAVEASKCRANASECHHRLGEHGPAVDAAAAALALDATNIKATFRRGRAKLELLDFEGAMEDLGAAVGVGESKNADAEALFATALRRQRLATFSDAMRSAAPTSPRGGGRGDDGGGKFAGLDAADARTRLVDSYRLKIADAADLSRSATEASLDDLEAYFDRAAAAGCVPDGWDDEVRDACLSAVSDDDLLAPTTARALQDKYVAAGKPVELYTLRALAGAIAGAGAAAHAAAPAAASNWTSRPPFAPPPTLEEKAVFHEAYGARPPKGYERLDLGAPDGDAVSRLLEGDVSGPSRVFANDIAALQLDWGSSDTALHFGAFGDAH